MLFGQIGAVLTPEQVDKASRSFTTASRVRLCVSHENLRQKVEKMASVEQELLSALESLLIYGDVYASGADGQSPYGRALKAVAKAKGFTENG